MIIILITAVQFEVNDTRKTLSLSISRVLRDLQAGLKHLDALSSTIRCLGNEPSMADGYVRSTSYVPGYSQEIVRRLDIEVERLSG